jgi:hypothetical protein
MWGIVLLVLMNLINLQVCSIRSGDALPKWNPPIMVCTGSLTIDLMCVIVFTSPE